MIKELDNIVLTVDLPEYRLRKGDVGTIGLTHGDRGCEVEFVRAQRRMCARGESVLRPT